MSLGYPDTPSAGNPPSYEPASRRLLRMCVWASETILSLGPYLAACVCVCVCVSWQMRENHQLQVPNRPPPFSHQAITRLPPARRLDGRQGPAASTGVKGPPP